MNVYILCPIYHRDKLKGYLKEVIMKLRELKCTVNDDIFKVNRSPRQIINRPEEEIVNDYLKVMKPLEEADVIIAEISYPSSGIGFMIASALANKKWVLCIYHKDMISKVPIPIEGNKSKFLFVR